MKKYQAAVMPAPNVPIEIREFPEPELEQGAALLHTMYSEVCGTDVHLHHGKLAGVPYPIIPGHVSVGVVAALRGSVHDVDGVAFREGDVFTFLDVHLHHGKLAGVPYPIIPGHVSVGVVAALRGSVHDVDGVAFR